MIETKKITAKNITDKEFFFGHKACAGCGGSLAVRLALKVLGEKTFSALPAGCMSAVGFIYPQMAFMNNAIISTFPGTGSMLSGMRAGLDALGYKDTHVVGFAGDGGTADIAYAATASVGYPQDYINKLTKAAQVNGTSYIHIYATCPTGWGTSTETSVSLAKEAVDCGMWYLAEYENSEFKLNRKPNKLENLKDHLLKQGRFKHLTDKDIKIIEADRDRRWERMLEKWS